MARVRVETLVRKSAIAPTLVAVFVSGGAAAQTIPISAIHYKCDTCATYADLLAYALGNVGTTQLGQGIAPGYSYPYIAVPGQTKILVSAAKAPISFAFNYTATKRMTYSYLNIYYYTFTFTPANIGFAATDDGALQLDTRIYGPLRASGIPEVKAPANDYHGLPVNQSYVTDYAEVFQNLISYNVLISVGGLKVRTLPGLMNWKIYPSIAVTYEGKYYVLFEGESLKVKLNDGTVVEMQVTAGTFGFTVGYLKVIKVTPPPTAPSISPMPSVSISLPAVNPIDLSYNTPAYVIYPWTPLRNGTVEVRDVTNSMVPIDFLWDVWDLIG